MTGLSFTVYGVAAPAGSKRALPAGGRPGARPIIVDDSKRSRPWKRDVAQAAGVAMNVNGANGLLVGPLALTVVFHVPRPKGHYRTGRYEGEIRSSAPDWPTVKPDMTKLLRAVEDACTGIVWRDDAQIVQQTATKRYGAPARCEVTVAAISAQMTLAEVEIAAVT